MSSPSTMQSGPSWQPAADAAPERSKPLLPWWAWVGVAAAAIIPVLLFLLSLGTAFSFLATWLDTDSEWGLTAEEQAAFDREMSSVAAPEVIAAGGIGPGAWTVGEDIDPGTYRPATPIDPIEYFGLCFWEVVYAPDTSNDFLSKFETAFFGHHSAYGLVYEGRPTVTLAKGDTFESFYCGDWLPVDSSSLVTNESAPPVLNEGVWLVGADLEPGTYTTERAIDWDEWCWWEVTEDLDGNFQTVVGESPWVDDEREPERFTITLERGQQIETSGCGTWSAS